MCEQLLRMAFETINVKYFAVADIWQFEFPLTDSESHPSRHLPGEESYFLNNTEVQDTWNL